jgi:hypothetical protein
MLLPLLIVGLDLSISDVLVVLPGPEFPLIAKTGPSSSFPTSMNDDSVLISKTFDLIFDWSPMAFSRVLAFFFSAASF